jgi:hypothetical protein
MPAAERIEDGDTIGTDQYRLAVHGASPGAELGSGGRDRLARLTGKCWRRHGSAGLDPSRQGPSPCLINSRPTN